MLIMQIASTRCLFQNLFDILSLPYFADTAYKINGGQTSDVKNKDIIYHWKSIQAQS